MKHYPYRTTYDKLEQALATVAESGDVVLSTHFLGGRDWVLLCRSGEPTLVDLSAAELGDIIERAVARAMGRASTTTSGTPLCSTTTGVADRRMGERR